ncbi:MAG: metallophosphoesterase, partial [Saprospiraceae bacterium]|nr:metallophosphoesterase [Saprospiraceae bacterium]
MSNRRFFLKRVGCGLAGVSLGFHHAAATSESNVSLTILHTNDVHSRIDPFPMDGGRNQGMGGAVRRGQLINRIRGEVDHSLLLDCGDIFQGTPYFNFFGGEVEFKLMSEMGYDASTIGNHDFDAGIEGLVK